MSLQINLNSLLNYSPYTQNMWCLIPYNHQLLSQGPSRGKTGIIRRGILLSVIPSSVCLLPLLCLLSSCSSCRKRIYLKPSPKQIRLLHWALGPSSTPESPSATAHFVPGNHCSNRLSWQTDLGRMQFHFCYAIKITEYLWNKILKRREISVKHKTETKSKLDTVLIKLATSLVLGIFQAWIGTTVFETATFLVFFFPSQARIGIEGNKGEIHFKRMSA